MGQKYNKIKIRDILEHVYQKYTLCLYGVEYFSTNEIAKELNTSTYQVRKHLKTLREKDYCRLITICTYKDDNDIERLSSKGYLFHHKRVEDFVRSTNRKFWLKVQNQYDKMLDEIEKELKGD